ncbi:hypothetical protein J4H86_14580 [Spiractinospora alimapuensis]|uniref:FUSC family protein n=1 Tax=Spiractinospora alimapuensis TaxID=2820884 RepID=UPI001F2E1A3C|nr:aromatic acid exporter family protein [Spiractinospora alimapuensis]QVQ50182.1 hypothetical protein J4H86_14580 [Spiractinospora alimapuensis]
MAQRGESEQLSENQPRDRGRIARIRQWWRRAAATAGHERDTLLFVGKGTLAASIAWVIAYNGMDAQSPAFAPFSAILMLQVTVYQSVVQSLRYFGAVTAGVAVQGLIVLVVGPDLVSFVLVALVALVLSRLPHLGAQRSQVSTAAFFAFSTYVAATDQIQGYLQLGQIVLLVIVGCGAGVLVNLLVFPPLRYRSAEYGVRAVGSGLAAIFQDMAPAVRDATLENERTDQWHSRAVHLGATISQARSSVQTAWESVFYNPRHVIRRSSVRSFEGYSALLDALERLSRQVTAVADDLRRLGGSEKDTSSEETEKSEEGTAPHSGDTRFLYSYGRFLGAVGEALGVLANLQEEELTEQQSAMREWIQEAEERYGHLRPEGREADADPSGTGSGGYEILVVDAARLVEELRATGDAVGACGPDGPQGEQGEQES